MKNKKWIKGNSSGNTDADIILNVGRLLGVKIRRRHAENDLRQHPDFPSFLSTSEVLKLYGIENEGVKIAREYIAQIPVPAIATLKGGTNSIIVTRIENDEVEYLDPLNGYIVEGIEFFSAKWIGPALLVDKNVNNKKVDRKKKNTFKSFYNSITIVLPVALLILSTLSFYHTGSEGIVFCVLSFIGVLSSTALMNAELGIEGWLSQFCITRRGCMNTMHSKLSGVLKLYNLSEAGLVYFYGNMLLLLVMATFHVGADIIASTIGFTSLTGVLFSFVSIYYQAIVVKSWCAVCNVISLVFWGLFTYSISILRVSENTFAAIEWIYIGPVIAIYATLLLFAIFIRQIIHINYELSSYIGKYRYLRNTPWFYEVLKMNGRPENSPYQSNELVIGNVNSYRVAQLILNLQSVPCKRLYQTLINAHKANKIQEYKVMIRFIIPKRQNAGQEVFYKMLNEKFIFSENESNEDKQKLIDSWFTDGMEKIEEWIESTPTLPKDNAYIQQHFNRLENWAKMNGVQTAPALIIENYFIPPMFMDDYIRIITNG